MTKIVKSAFACDTRADIAVAACVEQLDIDSPDLILAFIGGLHDPDAMLATLQGAFGDAVITGGAAAGVISVTGLGYTGFEIGLIAFKGAAVTPKLVTTTALLEGEAAAAEALGEAVAAQTEDGSVAMLLFDSVAAAAPLRLHPGSQIMEGFSRGLGARDLYVLGGGLLVDFNLSGGWLFDDGKVSRHAMTALLFPPGLTASTVILHGCRPVSTFMEITRIEGAEVFELDGEPALTVVERLLGLELGTTSGQQLSLVATLGQKQGDPFAPYDENNYVNRLILQANPSRGSITLFEQDFAIGTRVQIMSRDNALMLESVERGVAAIKQTIAGKNCVLGLYIDCAGRASVMTGAETEEAALVASALAPEFPFMGFYSGVEIAPFAGTYSRPLDWTGVLTILQLD
jgi:hypothetical protein